MKVKLSLQFSFTFCPLLWHTFSKSMFARGENTMPQTDTVDSDAYYGDDDAHSEEMDLSFLDDDDTKK